MKKVYSLILFIAFYCFALQIYSNNPKLGADRIDIILPEIRDKNIVMVVNQTSVLSNKTHLLDTLLTYDINIVKIFAPEHGFRGDADAGEKIIDGKDSKTGIDVVSLYGKNYKPSADQLKGIDVVIFDIQDVGTRFYTYISTMHYVMEACAENNKKCIILDRPNPNDYIDGPILDTKYKSFVGMHPIPILHGLTIGELANMINGEGWLKDKIKCDMQVITMEGWKHGQPYSLPIKPSPNLPNDQAIKLYPSLCFFEATQVSVGRGTDYPFQVVGAPNPKYGKFSFTPRSIPGAKNPLLKGKTCYGLDLRNYEFEGGLSLQFLIEFYTKSGSGSTFFSSPKFMDLLSGNNALRQQIIKGMKEDDIRETWQPGLEKYKEVRTKYLLYPL
jgi:uncharacterized protein YbbC (DUF1343 family)